MITFLGKKMKGVTLFEMLLVLFISSMIMLAAFKYEEQQKEMSSASDLAGRMFLFSQSVRMFMVNNNAAFEAGTYVPNPVIPPLSTMTVAGSGQNKTYTFTGVSWLTNPNLMLPHTNINYLSSSFTFNGLSPLTLMRDNLTGDDAIQVTISGTNITILYGDLYDARSTTKAPQIKVGETAMAANEAGKLTDPMLGPSTFQYHGGMDANGTMVPITATLLPSTSNSSQLANPIVSGSLNLGGNINNLASGAGQITNVEGITFDSSNPNQPAMISGMNTMSFALNGQPSSVENLNSLVFANPNMNSPGNVSPNTPATIENLNQLGFDPTPTSTNTIVDVTGIFFQQGGGITSISNLNLLNFSNAPSSQINGLAQLNFVSGIINKLEKLNFDPTSNANSITNLSLIQFQNGLGGTVMFTGVQPGLTQGIMNGAAGLSTGNSFSPMVNASNSSSVGPTSLNLSATSYFCSVTAIRTAAAAAGASPTCAVYVDNSGNYQYYAQNVQTCTVNCFRFAP